MVYTVNILYTALIPSVHLQEAIESCCNSPPTAGHDLGGGSTVCDPPPSSRTGSDSSFVPRTQHTTGSVCWLLSSMYVLYVIYCTVFI